MGLSLLLTPSENCENFTRQSKLNGILETIELLAVTEEALRLAQTLLEPGPLPKKAAEDALHVAIAVTNGIQFLLTWNCKHLANATTRPVVEHICRTRGYEPVIICTPEELLKE